MSIFSVFIGLLIAFAIVQAHDNDCNLEQLIPKLRDDVTEVNLNSFFDKRIEFIRRFIVEKDLDPMQMPDMMVPITEIPGFKGQIHLQKGWVQQLSTIQRTGDVIVRYKNKVMEFDLNLGWQDIDVSYGYTFRYLMGTRKGTFLGRFKDMKISVLASMDMENNHLSLRFFKIIDVGKFSLRLEGNTANWLINFIIRVVTIFAKERVVREIEYHIMKGVQEKIDEINDLMPDPYLRI